MVLFNLTTFGLTALLRVLRSWLVPVFVVGEVALMATEFIPLFIESMYAGFLLILILFLCSVLAILIGVVVTISSDFLKEKKTLKPKKLIKFELQQN